MKIIGWFMISVLLFSILSFTGCVPQESIPSLSLSPTTATNNITTRCELVATVTEDGTPVSDVAVRFEFDSLSCHNPLNLTGNESYEIEVCEWVESPTMCEWEYLSPLIAEHWKIERIMRGSSKLISCATGPNGEAKFAYWGIKPCTDTIVVSANVSGCELETTATVTWQPAENTCVLDLIDNSLSPTNSVVTPVEPLGDGKAVVEIDMGAGNYSVLEMKIEIQDPEGNYLLNIGNSPTNDGGGGDYGSFYNDSELDVTSSATYPDFILQLYANQYFSTPGAVVANLVPLFHLPTPTIVTWILRIKIADQKMCALVENTGALRGDVDNPAPESPHIFRLGGPDAEAGQNDFVYYAAFNRVIYTDVHPDRTGSGVTKVTFMWRTTWPGWEI